MAGGILRVNPLIRIAADDDPYSVGVRPASKTVVREQPQANIDRKFTERDFYNGESCAPQFEYRGDASATDQFIDFGALFIAKKLEVKNTDLANMLYVAFGPGAAAGDNSNSLQLAPGEKRIFSVWTQDVQRVSLSGATYRVTVYL